MAIALYDADPDNSSTGRNTFLKVIQVDGGEALQAVEVPHDLGFEPAWIRVTRLGYNVPDNGGLEPTLPSAICQPAILADSATLLNEGFKLDPGAGGATIDPEESAWFLVQNDEADAPDAFFLAEFGRTHSKVK